VKHHIHVQRVNWIVMYCCTIAHEYTAVYILQQTEIYSHLSLVNPPYSLFCQNYTERICPHCNTTHYTTNSPGIIRQFVPITKLLVNTTDLPTAVHQNTFSTKPFI